MRQTTFLEDEAFARHPCPPAAANGHIGGYALVFVVAAVLIAAACGSTEPSSAPTGPSPPSSAGGATATVRFVYRASTSPRTDLPPSAQECVQLVGYTHIHPGWRGFARIEMTATSADRWEIAFSDVPTTVRQSIRVSDGNACDQNPTGAATRSVFANDVLLVEVVPTPGSGTEPGLAFSVSAGGRVTP